MIAAGFGAAVECFTFAEVYLRDGGRCYLCDLPTLPLTAPRQALAATIDHVVPVEQGGAHTLANVRLTHLVCNSVKRNRTPEQARLLIAAKPRLRVPRVRTPRPVPLGLPLLHHLQELAKVPRERPSGLPLIDSLLPVS